MTGTAENGQAFAGTFDVTSFAVRPIEGQNQLVAVGQLTGDLGGQAIPATTVEWPVELQQTEGSCEILTLVLGPLDLNLLGLRVQLNQVELEITAVPGPGNLLGNLLCAVAGLLDNPGQGNALQQIVNLLNQILGLLG